MWFPEKKPQELRPLAASIKREWNHFLDSEMASTHKGGVFAAAVCNKGGAGMKQ